MKKEIGYIVSFCSIMPNFKQLLFNKCFFKMLHSAIDLLLTLILGLLIEAVFFKNEFRLFFLEASAYLILFSLRCMFDKLILVKANQIQERAFVDIRQQMFGKIMQSTAKQLSGFRSGELVQTFGQDVEDIYTGFNALENIMMSAFQIMTMFLIISYYSLLLSFLILFLAFGTIGLTSYSRRKYQEYRKAFRRKQGEYVDWINEHLKGMKDIRMNQSQPMMLDMFDKHTKENLINKEKIRFIEIRSERLLGFMASIVTVVFWSASATMIFKGILTIGIFYVANKYFGNLIANISAIGQEITNIRNYIPSFEKVKSILTLKENMEDSTENEDIKDNGLKNKHAGIRLENVTFGYGDKKVIDHLDMAFEPGKMYVIVGANGEGKTTLMNLLLRFYKTDGGSITYDGKPIERYSLQSWRRHIGFVQQQSIIFDGSLKDNIMRYAPAATDSKIWSALKMAGMYETVKEWTEGIDKDLKHGAVLSEGQKQRIAITRIIAKNPEIILMDEPTAALDQDIEGIIISDMKKIYRDKILIIITHRIAVVKQADIVMLMKGGNACTCADYETLAHGSSAFCSLFGL